MSLATLCSRVLGLVRETVFAYFFGAGDLTDAFQVAFRIPNLLRNLFAEGALSASLVPTFTGVRELEGDRRAWRLAGLVFRTLLIGVGALSLLGAYFSPALVSLYASSFREVPGKFELTVRLTRVLFLFFPFVAVSAAYMGILNACGRFFLPAFSAALFNAVAIGVGVPLVIWLPTPILGMAIGIVAGAVAQAACQRPALARAGYRWQPHLPGEPRALGDPALRRILSLMLPAVVGLAATQLSVWVNTWLATRQGPGSVSYLHYAFRLLQFPIGLFGVSFATAALPVLSRHWARREPVSVEATLQRTLRHVLAANVPAAAGLVFLASPIIALLFQYGRFGAADTEHTAAVLALYALGLPAFAVVKILVSSCYALGNTRTPVMASLFTVLFSAGLNVAFVGPFGISGLALGTSIGAYLNAVILLVAIRRMLAEAGGKLDLTGLVAAFGRQILLSCAMGFLVWTAYRGLDRMLPESTGEASSRGGWVLIFRTLKMGVVISFGGLSVWFLARVLAVRDTTEVFDLFAEKVKKKLSAAQK